MFIVVIMLERKIRHKNLQALLARRVPEDMFFVYMLLLFFHDVIDFSGKLSFISSVYSFNCQLISNRLYL